MITKDYVYLGLILLTALAFYCNGFYAGVYRCKRMYDSLLDDPEEDLERPEVQEVEAKSVYEDEKVLAGDHPESEPKVVFGNRELKGDFGKN
jgi:hypothetical protein